MADRNVTTVWDLQYIQDLNYRADDHTQTQDIDAAETKDEIVYAVWDDISEVEIAVDAYQRSGNIGYRCKVAHQPFDGVETFIDIGDVNYWHPAHSIWADAAGFRPIGTNANPFTGTYNGKNFEIQDLFIDRATTDNVGLFGYVGVGADGEAYLQKIRLKDVDITGQDVVGSVFARTDSENVLVENSSADGGTVTGRGGVGGFVGVVIRATIRQSWANITVTGMMTIDASSINAGGFAGNVLQTTCLHDCYSRGNASIYNRAGGFAGNINNSPNIQRCYSTGKPTVALGQTAIGGFIGNDVGVSGETIENCYWDKTTAEIATDGYLAVEAGLTTAEAKDKANYTGWNFNTMWNIGTDNNGYPYLDRRAAGIPTLLGSGTLLGNATLLGSGGLLG